MEHSPLDSASLAIALAMVSGVIVQAIARHARLPGIVLLLAIGVLLGPDVADIIRTSSMGAALPEFVGFAVAIILFEGGLNLNLKNLLAQAKPIRRLVLFGGILTATGGAVAARLFMGWEWRVSILFGTLVIVTGPTVITPLLRRIKIHHHLEVLLEAEGIFIDAVGATIAVVALEVLLSSPGESFAALSGIGSRFGVGGFVGFAGGALLALLLRWRKVVPEGLHNILTLAFAVAIFQVSNAMVEESGIIAAVLAGVVVGNARSHVLDELKVFQDQLTVLLISTLFVLLAADVRIADVRDLGAAGLVTVAVLMLVVRPGMVFLSTWGTVLDNREKAFVSWLGPRGIVAAAVSSLFAQRLAAAGLEGGIEMRALVFLVIAVTVVVQGLTGGIVAHLLGVRRKRNEGYLLLGAHSLGLEFGKLLRDAGEHVVFIDMNPECCRNATEQGFEVICDNGLEQSAWLAAQADSRAACIGITPSEDTNFLFACKLRERFRDPKYYVALETTASGVTEQMVIDANANVLFGSESSLELWEHRMLSGRVSLERWRYAPTGDSPEVDIHEIPANLLFVVGFRKGRLFLIDQDFEPKAEDVVQLALFTPEREATAAWLADTGWQQLDDRRAGQAAGGR